jgi:hypothetical protein
MKKKDGRNKTKSILIQSVTQQNRHRTQDS